MRQTRFGLLLLLVTPCTDWYLVFTAMARGHVGIATALLPVNLVLQLLLPVYVLLLGGEATMVDTATLLEAVLLILLTPQVVAFTLRWLSTRLKGERWWAQHANTWAKQLVLPMLCLAVFAMFAWQSSEQEHPTGEGLAGEGLRGLAPVLLLGLVIRRSMMSVLWVWLPVQPWQHRKDQILWGDDRFNPFG